MNFDLVVLVHLGCASEIEYTQIKHFLREFLGDKYVLNLPYLIRKFLAYRISNKRAKHFLEMQKSCAINSEPASIYHTKKLVDELSLALNTRVFEAGVYGQNNLLQLRKKMAAENLLGGKILFVVCYPQIASSTVFPAIREIERAFKGTDFKIAKGYAKNPKYAEAIANSVISKNENFDAVITSFHSIPKSQQSIFDYDSECKNSFFEIRNRLNPMRVEFAYQSSMKFGKWLSPNVFDVAKNLADEGVKNLAVVSPGFFCDCTETLIEIDLELRSYFLKCGGKKFSYINCLNSSSSQVKLFSEIVKNNCDV